MLLEGLTSGICWIDDVAPPENPFKLLKISAKQLCAVAEFPLVPGQPSLSLTAPDGW